MPRQPTRLTVGMATHRDFSGAYFTLQSIRMQAQADGVLDRLDFVVIDNDPDGPFSERLRNLVEAWIFGRYVVEPIQGTSAGRDRIFREAQTDAVLVLDSHVLLYPGEIRRLLQWYDEHPDSLDLLSGPLIYDDLRHVSTHMADQWRDGMWGTWDYDERYADPSEAEFEIPAMGLGLFSCRKEAWLGFNPLFREFGGEEWYIHTKFRQAGRRCLCLPWLKWVHRFGNPDAGRPGGNGTHARIRNYILGHRELGLPLDRVRQHFLEMGWIKSEEFAVLERYAETYPVVSSPGQVGAISDCPTCGQHTAGVVEMAGNALAAAGRVATQLVTGGQLMVGKDQWDQRLKICIGCDRLTGRQCQECGCFVDVKTSLATEKCPLEKWS